MKRFDFLLYILFFLPLSIFAQFTPEEIAIARTQIEENSIKADSFCTILYRYHSGQTKMSDSTMFYAKKMVEIGESSNSEKIQLQGFILLSYIFIKQLEVDSASYYLNAVLDRSKDAQTREMGKLRADAFLQLGGMYKEQKLGDEKAFSYLQEAIEVSKKHMYPQAYMISSMAMAQSLLHRKEYDEVQEILSDGYKFVDEIGDHVHKDWCLNKLNLNKAIYLAKVGTTEKERKESIDLMMEAYEYRKRTNRPAMCAIYFMDMVSHMSDYFPKEKLLELGEENYLKNKDRFSSTFKGRLLEAYGKVLTLNEQYEKAIPLLKEAKILLKKNTEEPNYMRICETLMSAYEHTNQREKIISEFKDYKIFQDSFIATVYSDQLLDLEKKYKTEKKDRENAELTSLNQMIQARYQFSVIIGALLLGLLAAGIYFFLKMRKTKKELAQYSKELADLNQIKDQFFAIIAHDMRGLVLSFKNVSKKVNFLRGKGSEKDVDVFLKNIDKSADSLSNLLDNLLNWALVEKGVFPYHPELFNLERVVMENIKLFTELSRIKDIPLSYEVHETLNVYADKNAVSTIIRNLMNNAIKYSSPGAAVIIKAHQVDGKIQIEIKDTGEGIESEALEKIFQLDTQKTKQGTLGEKGTGLGLVICKELIMLNKGDINIKSEEGKGTSVFVGLPLTG